MYITHLWQLTLMLALPVTHSISPSRADNKDDFPDPTEPTIATSDPSGMLMFMLRINKYSIK